MKTSDLKLELQAYVDGELSPDRRAGVESLIAGDSQAREWVEGLRQISLLVRTNEPDLKVPSSREFYWSQIKRQMDQAQASKEIRPASAALNWFRWVVPAVGVAAVVVVVVSIRSDRQETLLASNFDSMQTDSSAVVFRSESDGVTIHWID
ncbi:MAG: hypothetical protein EXS25_11540 [Pedosphaera sp.]|nr:hypothetical protein [Pedosphaera sp.]